MEHKIVSTVAGRDTADRFLMPHNEIDPSDPERKRTRTFAAKGSFKGLGESVSEAGKKFLASLLDGLPSGLQKIFDSLAKDTGKWAREIAEGLVKASPAPDMFAKPIGQAVEAGVNAAIKKMGGVAATGGRNIASAARDKTDAMGMTNPNPQEPNPTWLQRMMKGLGGQRDGATRSGANLMGGDLRQIVSYIAAEQSIASVISKLSSAQDQYTRNATGMGDLYRYGGMAGSQKNLLNGIVHSSDKYGYSDDVTLDTARTYFSRVNTTRGGVNARGDSSRLLGFATAYGLDPSQMAGTFGDAASMGYTGNQGLKGGMSLAAYQATMASAYSQTGGNVKMDDFASGFQQLARSIQGITLSLPNMGSTMGYYSAMNRSGNPALMGANGAALLGDVQSGLAGIGASHSGVAYSEDYSALVAANHGKYLSPSKVQYDMEDPFGTGAFKSVMQFGEKQFGGADKFSRWKALQGMLGLSTEHAAGALESAFVGKNGQWKGGMGDPKALMSFISGHGGDINKVDMSAMPLLADLAGGKDWHKVLGQAKELGVKGLGKVKNANDLGRLLAGGAGTNGLAQGTRTIDTSPDKAFRDAAASLRGVWVQQKKNEAMAGNILEKLGKITQNIPGGQGAMAVGASLALPALALAPHLLNAWTGEGLAGRLTHGVGHLIGKGAGKFMETPAGGRVAGAAERIGQSAFGRVVASAGSRGAGLAGRAGGVLVRVGGRLVPIGAAASVAVAGGAVANNVMDHIEAATIQKDPFHGQHWENSAINNVWGLGGIFGHKVLVKNGQHYSAGDEARFSVADDSVLRDRNATILGGLGNWMGLQAAKNGKLIPGGAHGGGALDPTMAAQLQTQNRSHNKNTSAILVTHSKAQQDLVEQINTDAFRTDVLDATDRKTLTQRTKAFTKDVSDQVTQWGQDLLAQAGTAITSSLGSSGGSSGGSGGSGGDTGGSISGNALYRGSKGGMIAAMFKGKAGGITQGFAAHDSEEPAGYQYADGSVGYTAAPGAKKYDHLHNGIDIATRSGTAIYATQAGKIAYAGDTGDLNHHPGHTDKFGSYGFGGLLEVDSGKYTTFNAHMRQFAVKSGQYVKKGQLIGYSGGASSDPMHGNSTGAHMHFSVLRDQDQHFVDPTQLGGYSGGVTMGSGGGPTGGGGMKGWTIKDFGGTTHTLTDPKLRAYYQAASKKYGVPLSLLLAQGFRESSWNPKAVQGGGMGRGIAQFDYSAGNMGAVKKYLGTTDMSAAFDPQRAIMGQAHYMSDLYNQQGSWQEAAHAYNGLGGKESLYAIPMMQAAGLPVNTAVGGGAFMGGGASMGSTPHMTFDPITIQMHYPDGHMQTIRVQPKAKFQGVAGVSVNHNPATNAHVDHAKSRPVVRR